MKQLNITDDQKQLQFEDNTMLAIPYHFFSNYDYVETVQMHVRKCHILTLFDFSDFANLRKLHIVANDLQVITNVTFSSLTLLTDLHFEAAIINSLPEKLLFHLPKLNKVVLIVPKVESVAKSIFNSTTQIRDIKIVSSLLSLHSATFSRLQNVQHFEVQNVSPNLNHTLCLNRLHFLELSTLLSLQLYRVDCSNFQLKSQVRKIILKNCALNSIYFLTNLSALSYLELSDCDLEFDTNNILNYNQKLSTLILNGNVIDRLDRHYFDSFVDLLYLDISNCKITTVNNYFLGMAAKSINVINLEGNSIRLVSRNMLKHCNRLFNLNLGNNSIQIVHKHCFDSLYNLKSLHLETNQITRLPDKIFYNLNAVTYLNLSYNSITFVKTRWFNVNESYQLITLDLNSNQIEYIEKESLKMLLRLQFLDISGNIFNSLEEYYFENLQNLFELNLSYNKLCELKRCFFKNLKCLNVLKLQANYIHLIEPNTFTDLNALQTLDLGGNFLISLDENVFKRNYGLQRLYLDCNCLNFIPRHLFRYLDHLDSLNVAQNIFEVLQWECFEYNRKLRVLYVDEMVRNNLPKKLLNISTVQKFSRFCGNRAFV